MVRLLCIVVGLVLCLVFVVCKVDLYFGFIECEVNEMLVVLILEYIFVEKEVVEGGVWQFKVEESCLFVVFDVFCLQGLLYECYVSIGDVFQKQGLVFMLLEECMCYIYVVLQELL